jgi:sialate O-acetylesterase
MTLLMLVCPAAHGDVTLASRFSNHMVLQRALPITIDGIAGKNEAVSVELGEQRVACVADGDGRWRVALKPMKAGGPFSLNVTAGKDATSVEDILIGDVWLCAGQSNMQLAVIDSHGGKDALSSASTLKNVRLLLLPKKPAKEPQTTLDAKWMLVTADSAAPFSAVGFYFAAALRTDPKLDDVAIGLIDNSFGGTAAEAWISPEVLKANFKPDDLLDSIFGIKPTDLFNGMVMPITDVPLKGVLWYQGESNVPKAGLYKQMLTTMIGEWRGRWHQPDLPFLLVQLPNYPGHKGMDTFAWIREAQELVAKSVKNCWFATIIDTPDGFDLHPKHKRMVGERLALLARKNVYDEQVVANGPAPSAVTIEAAGKVRVAFDTAGSALVNKNAPGPLRGFMVAGDDGVYRSASATIDGDSVWLEGEQVAKPLTARYAWLADPDADLQNSVGLPAAPFRTDSFPIEPPIELQRVLPVRRVATSRYDALINGAGVLTSITIDGHQLLSNEGVGGLTIDGFFGPRNLYDVTERSPREIEFTDGGVRLAYAFGEDHIAITVRNGGNEHATARLHCCGSVKVSEKPAQNAPASVTAARDGVSASFGGFDSKEDSPLGTRMIVKVAPHAERELRIQVDASAVAPK